MRLSLNQAYVSIKDLQTPSEQLPQLIVITGFNGSGKTHLLQAIDNKFIVAFNDKDEEIKKIKFFNYESLKPTDETIDPNQLKNEKDFFWNKLAEVKNSKLNSIQKQIVSSPEQTITTSELKDIYENLSAILEHNTNYEELDEPQKKAVEIKNAFLEDYKSRTAAEVDNALKQNQPNNTTHQTIRTINQRGGKPEDIIDHLQQQTLIPLFLIDRKEFDNLYDPIIPYSPFQRSYSMWFSRYMNQYLNNKFNEIDHKKIHHKDTKYLDEEDFFKRYGSFPWEEINEFFKIIGLPFEINSPHAEIERTQFRAVIKDQDDNIIDFNHFSSGEKIILALVAALSYENKNDRLTTLPELLLLDEVDAPLHPAMTKLLFKTVQEAILGRQGISVIMTTHSPSTVAMAPENSLYELKKNRTTKNLAKISKDVAIARLTSGVPTLSVNYENRRLIFVESKYDAEYYTKLDELIRYHFVNKAEEISDSQISLIFHSAGGHQKGGSDLVKEHTRTLRSSGLLTVYGVIDWDKKNNSSDSVFVLGEKQGYSIETFLLDPLIMGCLLLHDNIVPNSLSLPIISANEVVKLEQEKKQSLVNTILKLIASDEVTSDSLITRAYAGKFTLELPCWFCHHEDGSNGHDLEARYLEKIPQLKKYGKELKSACINLVLRNYSDLIPNVFIDLMQKLRSK